jgi:hypothetical protein
MKKYTRALLVGVGAVLALGMFSACSSGTSEQAATTTETTSAEAPTTAAAMPQTATFVAQMPEQDGHAMTMAVTVQGDQVAAYACNGTDDEAWFFGSRKDGVMNLTSKFMDTMTATYNGAELTGTLTMDNVPQPFSARLAAEPAGIYTAAMNGERASWIVMPDGQAMGIQNRTSRRDDELIGEILQQQQDFQDKVRQMRLDRQLQQAPQLNMNTMDAAMDGTMVKVTRVTGSTRFN